jgi:catechol 2,3-dioxygenase-like lactoylglutathione lyase family enzyme
MKNQGHPRSFEVSETIRKKLRLPVISQLGFVVRDADETARYYEQVFGLGPWSIMDGETTDCTNRGKPVTIRGKIGMAQVGAVQFELIQILEGESIHSEFFQERGEGLHHVGFYVRDLEARLEACKEAGIDVLQKGTIKQGPITINYAYLDTVSIGGVVFEYIQYRLGPVPVVFPPFVMKGLSRLGALTMK